MAGRAHGIRVGKVKGGQILVVALAAPLSAACGDGAGPPPWTDFSSLPSLEILQEGPSRPLRTPAPCTVTRIVDGDTLDCAPLGRIRLIGIDAPERGQHPFGLQATAALTTLAPVGSRLLAEFDVQVRDRYGRTLAYLWTDNFMVNWAMVRLGFAMIATYPPNVQYVERLKDAQTAAREEGRGFWGGGGFLCSPADYRAGRCR